MLPMRTIPQLLLERAGAAPGKLVERHKYRGIWREYTYGDVLEKVRSLALGLDAMGIRRGETLAIKELDFHSDPEGISGDDHRRRH